MSRRKNSRLTIIREQDGLRVVSRIVESYFRWGWQELDHKNDDGIDGLIMIRDRSGMDLGAMIKVQVKSGPSYLSSRVGNKAVRITPYSDKNIFKKHLLDYARSFCPVILVWVNTQAIDKNGRLYDDYDHPEIWWQRVDNYKYTEESVITLDRKLGEHSKGDLYGLVKRQIKEWIDQPTLMMDDCSKRLYNSSNLKRDAHDYYYTWSKGITRVFWEKRYRIIKINRTGWRHINNYKRGRERVFTSLRLLPLAKQIIEIRDIRPVLLNEKVINHNLTRQHFGLRCQVMIGDQIKKVQVVLIRMHDEAKKDKWRFYSIHEVK